jgi:hypothetical protein
LVRANIIEHCEECDGKVTNLTLKNNGPESLIRVEQNKNNIVVFEEVVRNGDTFSFSGVNKPYSCIKFPMIFRNKSFGCKISMAKHFLVFFLDVTIGEI